MKWTKLHHIILEGENRICQKNTNWNTIINQLKNYCKKNKKRERA